MFRQVSFLRTAIRRLASSASSSPGGVSEAPQSLPRFWKTVSTVEKPDGFRIFLDKRTLKSPGGSEIVVPPQYPLLASLVAGEWEGQPGLIKSSSLPVTSLVVRGTQSIAEVRDEVIENLLRYLHTDSVCYHQDESEENAPVELQNKYWNSIIDWANREFGVNVNKTYSIMSIRQDDKTVDVFRKELQTMTPLELAAFERAVMTSKSFLIALALVKREIGVEFATQASRVELTAQIDRWGEVEDAHDVDLEKVRKDLGSVVCALLDASFRERNQ